LSDISQLRRKAKKKVALRINRKNDRVILTETHHVSNGEEKMVYWIRVASVSSINALRMIPSTIVLLCLASTFIMFIAMTAAANPGEHRTTWDTYKNPDTTCNFFEKEF
jgi:hypothetical protein